MIPRLHFTVDGPKQAPAVVLIHPLGGDHSIWDAQAAEWAHSFRVIRYDMRGHGRSEVPPGEYALGDLASDAVAVLDASDTARAHVCGISLGALTTLAIGLNFPDRVVSLVVANTAARVGTRERWIERAARVRADGLVPIADAAMQTWFTESFRVTHRDAVARCHRMITTTNPDGYVGCCAALRDADLRRELWRITASTLVVCGTQDPTVTLDELEFIRDHVRSAQLMTLPSAHMPIVECASDFTKQVYRFLAEQSHVGH